MRDDQQLPEPREKKEPPKVVEGRRSTQSAEVAPSDQAEAAQADSPAALSATSHPADAEEAGLSDEEIAMYRRRVAEGLYNSREVADEVARRMLRRGDI